MTDTALLAAAGGIGLVAGYMIKSIILQQKTKKTGILTTTNLHDLRLEYEGEQIAHIFTIKKREKRDGVANSLLNDCQGQIKSNEKELEKLQDELRECMDELETTKGELENAGSDVERDNLIQGWANVKFMRMVSRISSINAVTNSLSYLESKQRFLQEVLRGSTRHRAIENLIELTDLTKEWNTKGDEIVNNLTKSVSIKDKTRKSVEDYLLGKES